MGPPAYGWGSVSAKLVGMGTYAALLRGINVGRAKRVAMADLRSLLEDLGHTDVSTILMSGNAVFGTTGRKPEAALAAEIEGAIRDRLGMDVRVFVRSAAALRKIVDGNPMPERAAEHPSRFHVSLFDGEVDREALATVLEQDWTPERIEVGDGALYLWHPGGMTGSKLAEALGRAKGPVGTVRNWATLTKLLDRAEAAGPAAPAGGRSGPKRSRAPRGRA